MSEELDKSIPVIDDTPKDPPVVLETEVEETPTITDTVETSDDTLVLEEPNEKEEEPEVKEEVKDTRKKQDIEVKIGINASVNLDNGDIINLPSNYDKETADVIAALPNINMIDSPDSREWAEVIQEGLQFNTMNEMFVPTLEEEGTNFAQGVEYNGKNLAAASPKFTSIENANIKGERALLRIITHLGLGTVFQVPLWHSGFWISFKPPTESEIVEFNRLLISDKISFGRQTYGLAYSNTTVYTTDRVIDFALSHVYDITTKSEDINLENIKNHISCQDIHSLIWGFLCTMYPRGFRYRRGCIDNPEKCNYILEETLNVSKLQWTNTLSLTEWQKTHMSTRQSKIKDLSSVNRYKEELNKIQKKRIVINEGKDNNVTIVIKTPNVTEFVDAGHKWIGGIVDSIEKTVGTDLNHNDRDSLITRYAQASSIRQYVHWIESIEYDTNIIDDRETIETTLSVLSSDDDIRNQIIKTVVDFINQSTVSIIGIPVFDCPNCGKTQNSTLENVNSNFKNIIPLDTIQLFFALVTQRLQRLTDR